MTIDGLGAAHDATRHLRGGSPTFERIAGNLRDTRIPFKVDVRHNVYAGNRDEVDALDSFVMHWKALRAILWKCTRATRPFRPISARL